MNIVTLIKNFFKFLYKNKSNIDKGVTFNLMNQFIKNNYSKEEFDSSYAIVVQGPFVKKNHFTLNTLKLYRKIYPNIIIIYSGWDEDRDCKDVLSEIGVKTIFSEFPSHSGLGNLNYQIVTSSKGVALAKSLGVDFVLKSRADQRMCSGRFLEDLKQFFNEFSDSPQKPSKLIGISKGTFIHRVNSISDMLMFGKINDMVTYWSPPLDQRGKEKLAGGMTIFESVQAEIAEVYFFNNYIRSKKKKPVISYEFWFSSLAEFFIIIDSDMLNLYWPKYSSENNYYKMPEVTFSVWLGIKNKNIKPFDKKHLEKIPRYT